MNEPVIDAPAKAGPPAVRVGLTLGGIVLGAVVIFGLGVMVGSRVTELAPVVAAPPSALPTETLVTLPTAPVASAAAIPPDKLTFYDRLSGVAPAPPPPLPEDQPHAQAPTPAPPASEGTQARQPETAPPRAAAAVPPKRPAAPAAAGTAARTAPPSTDPAARIRKLGGKGRFTVQMAAVSDPAAAAQLAASIKRNGFDAVTVMASVKGKIVYRIRVGSFPNKQAAAQAAGIFRSAYRLNGVPAEN